MRPTRTRDNKMHYSTIDIKESFITKDAALMAFQMAQLYFIQAGFLTTSSVNIAVKRIELTVHFDLPNFPTIPNGYKYSRKEITSHTYYSEVDKQVGYVRCLELIFKY